MNKKRRRSGIMAIVLILLSVTIAYAVYLNSVKVETNVFQTGYVEINLNDSKPIFTSDDFQLEPNAMVIKTFFVENLSTDPVYYRLYAKNAEGSLKDATTFTLYAYDKDTYDEDTTAFYNANPTPLKSVAVGAFTLENAVIIEEPLEIGGKAYFAIAVTMNSGSGNAYQGDEFTFELVAEAVQTKNQDENNIEFNEVKD